MNNPALPLFVPIGANTTRVFGLDAKSRACRLAAKAGLSCADQAPAGGAVLLANLAFAWDPAWLKMLAAKPGTLIASEGRPVLAHVPAGADSAAVAAAMQGEGSGPIEGMTQLDAATAEVAYADLRKRERPFVLPLSDETADRVERAAYDASYKGVTDALTLYLWRRPAFYLTRWAAQAGVTPNAVTAVGTVLCVLAFYLFWNGHYWLGTLSGFAFMVLDTVDGKLARCTGASSWWGNIFDHGIDLIHPPFWWWAWLHGLVAYGRPLELVYSANVLAVIVAGYIVQRGIEGVFMRRFAMHIHVWQQIDSRFRLITARRNPNMVILVLALLFGRPDVGIELLALWTLLSLAFHAVRLAQAEAADYRGEPVVTWLS
ncbi:MAG: CDP-alcohol phosphatidyltransferase family protein [Pseudomonadota bacterium]|nr:CDP-alcohol phosphatidyltransferase family protein [Pseudomonadota bacterium]